MRPKLKKAFGFTMEIGHDENQEGRQRIPYLFSSSLYLNGDPNVGATLFLHYFSWPW